MHDPTWAPQCVEDELLVALVAFKRALHNAAAGTDPGTVPVLHHLAATGGQRQTQVAAALGLDASTISRHVRTLLRANLIDATADPDDRRAMRLSLTPAGLAQLRTALEQRRAELQAATADFTLAERAELIRLLTKCTANMTERAQART
ncbi:MAG: MarR family winged helix-turn-helix transcriptional regulator [Candidatus Nanopelagicales bacterium]